MSEKGGFEIMENNIGEISRSKVLSDMCIGLLVNYRKRGLLNGKITG